MHIQKANFYSKAIKTNQRIGCHEQKVIDVLVGSLLGDGWAEKRSNATRFHIHMSSRNVEYLNWLHLFFSKKGYCSPEKPKLFKQIGKHNKVYFSYKFRTFSFSSLNWLYNSFYTKEKIKFVSKEIDSLLTPRAFAVWIMDDGGISGQGMKISTESFCLQDIIFLQKVILENYKISCTIQRHKDKYILYFPKKSIIFSF